MVRKNLTNRRLKNILNYNEKTGNFRWIKPQNIRTKTGCLAGRKSNGYILITIDQVTYSAHRLAWFYIYGFFPVNCLDHINGVRHDNRICNLRPATRQQNAFNRGKNINNKSGYRGVFWNKSRERWNAVCTVNKKRIYLGSFKTPKAASLVYVAFAKKHYGEFLI